MTDAACPSCAALRQQLAEMEAKLSGALDALEYAPWKASYHDAIRQRDEALAQLAHAKQERDALKEQGEL